MKTTTILIIAGILFAVVSVGVKAGRWAQTESQNTETRYTHAMSILLDK